MDAITLLGYGMGAIMFGFSAFILFVVFTQPHDDDD